MNQRIAPKPIYVKSCGELRGGGFYVKTHCGLYLTCDEKFSEGDRIVIRDLKAVRA